MLQTSCSSGKDDYLPLPKPKTDRRKSEVNGRRSQVLSSKVLAPLNAPKSSVEDKENECAGTQSLGGIEKALLESNKLLKGVLHRVDKCEKQIRSFESKLEESVSSTSIGSTPSRKKVQVPEEVRVRDWYMCNGFAGHTVPQKSRIGFGILDSSSLLCGCYVIQCMMLCSLYLGGEGEYPSCSLSHSTF